MFWVLTNPQSTCYINVTAVQQLSYSYTSPKQNCEILLRRAFRLAKSSIILLTSSFRATAFSMDKIASPDNRSCCMVFLRYVLINLSLEKDLSAVATVTGNVRNIKKPCTNRGRLAAENSSWQSGNLLILPESVFVLYPPGTTRGKTVTASGSYQRYRRSM